jgi:hypothetical protein
MVDASEPGPRSRPTEAPLDASVMPGVSGCADGCVVPSIVTAEVTAGRGVAREIVGAAAAPGTAKVIVPPPAPFAAMIASRSEQRLTVQAPSFESAVVVTTNVPAAAAEPLKSNATTRRAATRPKRATSAVDLLTA